MKVLSRSRWPLPPKMRTGAGREDPRSNDPPSRGGHVDVLWVWVCQVWGVAWLKLATKGRKGQTAGRQDGHQAAAVSDGSRPNWPVTGHQGSLPPSLRSLLGGWLGGHSGGSRLKTEEIWLHSKPLTKPGPSHRSCVNLLQCWLKLSSSRPWHLALTQTPYEFHQQLIWNKTSSTHLVTYCTV